jgi:DNA-binding transcriptional ArsR family regulator
MEDAVVALELDEVFGALADPTRREILRILKEGERSTGALAESFPVTRPAVSRHLRVLADAGLVERRRDGRHQFYRVAPDRLVAASDWLAVYAEHWRGGLRRLKAYVEESPGDGGVGSDHG